jgi:hypothetical protein
MRPRHSRRHRHPPHPPELSTRGLIEEVANGVAGHAMTLGDLLDRFRERSYGVFLLICVLPAFVPLPIGAGAVSGPLVSLIGVQFLAQMQHPWVPGFIARRPLSAEGMDKFRRRTARLLGWLEKVSRPRNEAMIDHRAARTFTGLLLVLLGALLALPLPATNYPFGAVLLLYAIALIERDGRLMAIAWAAGLVEIGIVAAMSGQIAAWLGQLFS